MCCDWSGIVVKNPTQVAANLESNLQQTVDALESLTAGLVQAGSDSKEGLSQLTAKLEAGHDGVTTTIDTARHSLDHILEALENPGVNEIFEGSVSDNRVLNL